MITFSFDESNPPKAKDAGFGGESDLGVAIVDEIRDGAATVVVAVPKLKEAVVLLNANIDRDGAAEVVRGAVDLLSPKLMAAAGVEMEENEGVEAAVVVTEEELVPTVAKVLE